MDGSDDRTTIPPHSGDGADSAEAPSSVFLTLLADVVDFGVPAPAHGNAPTAADLHAEDWASASDIQPAAGGTAATVAVLPGDAGSAPVLASLTDQDQFLAYALPAAGHLGHGEVRTDSDDASLAAFAAPGFAPLARAEDSGSDGDNAGSDLEELRQRWAADPVTSEAASIGPGGPVLDLIPNDPLFVQQWHLAVINVESVWNDYNGAGVLLGLIDDGVEYTHPDLAANYNTALDYDARSNDNDAFSSSTSDMHGTSVAGTMAAVGNNGIDTTGVAYGAGIVGFRMGFGAAGSVSQITANFQHAIVVDVVNNSWGYSGYFTDNFKSSTFAPTAAAIQNDVANGRGGLGTVIVFAAGNSRTSGDSVDYHGFQDSKYVISVAATDETNHVTYFSNPGAGVLVAAPGLDILTTDRVGSLGFSSGDTATVSGTSFSAPIVSGVVALMLEANPNLGYRDVQEILAYSADKVDTTSPRWSTNGADNWNGGGLHFSPDYGFGLVDAHAAVRLAETWTLQSTYANMVTASAGRSTSQAIPDNNASGISQTVTIGSHVLIDHVEVDLNITHTWIGDLRVILVSPDGTQSVLVDRPGINPDTGAGAGTSQDNINFNFSSNQFWGEDSAGTWTLIVSDNNAGNTGSLVSWNLTVSGDTATNDNTYVYTDEYAGMTGVANAARRTLTDSDGGHDAINASAVTTSSFLDMVPGHTSTIAGNSLTISAGTVIEDAYMGDGNDTVIGNSADNVIFGGRGDDSLDGGAGNDTALYLGPESGYNITIVDSTHVIVTDIDPSNVNEGTDHLVNFEFLQFSDFLYVLNSGPLNTPPTANTDTPTTNEDTAVTVAVLANDTDVDGDTLSVTGKTDGAHGTVVINADNTVTYTPNANYNGSDSFTYTVSDGHGGSAVGTVNVAINPVNDNPVADTDTPTTNEDTPVTVAVLANDTDVDGDTLSVTGKTDGAHGTVVINADNTVTYTPNANYNGSDSFTYTVSDGHGGSAVGTVNVTVNPVNDNPVANTDTPTTNEDTAVTVAVLSNDTDVDGDTLSVTAKTNGAHGTVAINADNTVTYTPNANYNGSDSFTYTVSDGHGGSAVGTVNVTVNPVNDNPVANTDTAGTNQDTAVTVAVLANDVDVDGDTLSVTAKTDGAHGTVAINVDNTVTYTPNAGYTGADSFTYTVSDGHGGSATGTVNVTVNGVNHNPTANTDAPTTNEDTPVTVAVLANDTDPDGDTLSVTGKTDGAHGTVVINADDTVTYTPAANYNGSDSFSYTVSDGHGGTATATVNVTINPVNDNPVANTDTPTTNEDAPVTVAVLANDTDVDGDTLSVTGKTDGAHGTVVINADNTVTYTPAANYNGSDSFTYTVSDGHGGTATGTVNVAINPVNDNPVANTDTPTTNEDAPVTVAVLANDTDVDGDTLSVTAKTDGAHGTVVINADNTVTYTPNAGYTGGDSFTYTVSDGHGGSATGTVNVTVNAVNVPPVANTDTATTLEDAAVIIAVLANDTDGNGDALSVTGTTNGAHGTVTTNGTTVTYTPITNYNGSDSFTYSISDGHGGTATGTVNVTVTPVNDNPVANPDSATTAQDTPITVNVLGNDIDVDGDTLSVAGTTNPAHGNALVNANGTITYTPDSGYFGSDSFSYTASDGHGGTSSAIVSLTVAPAAPPEPVTLLSANFDSGSNGFSYSDDAFLNTHNSFYEFGVTTTSGYTGGGLLVSLGGINNQRIIGMSGGWEHDINLAAASDVTITFRYNLTQSPNYESNEYSQVLLSVDGTLYGTNGHSYVDQVNGNGNGGPSITTGWQIVTIDLGVLSAGDHTVVIGGYNNQKDASNESTTIALDDVTVTGTATSGGSSLAASTVSPASTAPDTLSVHDVLGNDVPTPHADPGPVSTAETAFTASAQDIVSSLVDEHAVQAAACAA